MNQTPRPSWVLDGAMIAFIVGSVAFVVGGVTEELRGLLTEPLVCALGLGAATVLGGALARRAVSGTPIQAVAAGMGLGIGVAALVAALMALPVFPIAIVFSYIAWPVTIPAGLAWLVVLRWQARLPQLPRRVVAGLGVALAAALVVVRFTQPMVAISSAGSRCVGFPGERIETLAWAPDGAWLGVISEADGAVGVVRLIEQASGRIIELVRGPNVAVYSGLAVGLAGETTYLHNSYLPEGVSAADEWSAWTVSPSAPPEHLTDLPTPSLFDLTWTPEGVVGAWVDGPVGLVWVRPGSTSPHGLDEVDAEAIARNPALSPLVVADPLELAVRAGEADLRIKVPDDAAGDINVSPDGRQVVFRARAISSDGMDVLHDQLVALSTLTGERAVLVDEPAWEPRLGPNAVAYLTSTVEEGNSACVAPVR